MRLIFDFRWLAAMAVLLAAGCSNHPEPLTAAELPAAVQEAFATAQPEIKAIADEAVQSFQSNNFPKALVDFQKLNAIHELTEPQRNLAGRCLLTVNESLLQAQADGDEDAAKMIRYRQITK